MNTVSCPYCGEKNSVKVSKCSYCTKSLISSDAEIKILKNGIRRLKSKFSIKIGELENRLDIVENRLLTEKAQDEKSIFRSTIPFAQEDIPTKKKPSKKEKKATTEKAAPLLSPKEQPPVEEVFEETTEKVHIPNPAETEAAIKEAFEASRKEKQAKKVKEVVTESAVDIFLESAFEPFKELKDELSGIYNSYKEEGKLPVLFMTIGGIVAVLFSLGLLMQYVSDTLFDVVKTIVTLSAASGLTYGGIRLTQSKKKYTEFGAALLGLGISINYLVFFFQIENPILGIFSNWYGVFILIVINTFWASWLALRYETKIVALISLLGGTFAPFYLSGNAIEAPYFAYLWILCASSIYISQQIKWKSLGSISFIVASIAISESVIEYSNSSLITYTIVFHAFAYLFFYYSLFDKKAVKQLLKKGDIIVLIGAISLLLTALFFLYNSQNLDRTLGFVYLANAVVFGIGLTMLFPKLEKPIKLFYFLIVGTFITVSIPAIFDQQLMGIFWAIEGLVLIYAGFLFSLSSVRKEGFFILLITIYKISTNFDSLLILENNTLWNTTFINFLLLGIIIFLLKTLLYKYQKTNTKLEKTLHYFSFEIGSVWFMLALFKISYFYLENLTFNIAIIPMYFFIWWGDRNKLKITEWLGFSLQFLLIIGFLFSAAEVNSYAFRDQTILGKVAMSTLFFNLWVLQYFYQKVLKREAKKLYLMVSLRKLFYYCLPFAFIPSAYKYNIEYFPLAIWSGVLIAFVLHKFLKLKFLLTELYLLTVAVSAVILIAIFSFETLLPINIAAGVLVLFIILIVEKGYLPKEARKLKYKLIYSYGFYYLGFALTLLLADNWGKNYLEPLILTPIFYFVGLSFLWKKLHPIRANFLLAFWIGFVCLFWGGFMILFDSNEFDTFAIILFLIALATYHFLIYNKKRLFPKFGKKNGQMTLLYLLHLCNIMIYTGLISIFSRSNLGVGVSIALVLHAIILLFNSQKEGFKSLMKLSVGLFGLALLKIILKDMEHFSAQEKIISFLVIGLLLLGGGLLYLKLGKKEEHGKSE